MLAQTRVVHLLCPGGPLPRKSPARPKGQAHQLTGVAGEPNLFLQTPQSVRIQRMLQWPVNNFPLHVLIDCGADDDFTHKNIVTQVNIPVTEVLTPKDMLALDGKLLTKITHKTAPITLSLSGNHHDSIELCHFFHILCCCARSAMA